MLETLILTRRDVAELLSLSACIQAVEHAFEALGSGAAQSPVTASVHADGGAFHVKAGILDGYFAAKSNGNFPQNAVLHGLPTIQGLLLLCDAATGRVLAVMDSIEITALRTAAATAVAARHLARADSETAVICGCGVQGRVQVRALLEVLPLKRIMACDVDSAHAQRFAAAMMAELAIPVTAEANLARALADADVCVMCTTSTEFIVYKEMVRAGTFVAGVGVDNEHKRELAPDLLASAKLVTDLRSQCAALGDLHHALDAGIMTSQDVHADLADVVAGTRPGRVDAEEITVFDSTGLALQDVAAAIAVYKSAAEQKSRGAIGSVIFA